ncbi:hypothetical protein [Bacillus cereus]
MPGIKKRTLIHMYCQPCKKIQLKK